MKVKNPTFLSIPLLVFVACAARLYGEVITVRPSADTSLFEYSPTFNLGGMATIPAGAIGDTGGGAASRALYRFDVPGTNIPPGVTITNVKLTVRVTQTPDVPVNSVFELRRMLKPWIEGTKAGGSNGSTASQGEPTWNSQAHPATPWSAPGGAAPDDFSATVSASVPIAGLGAYTFQSTPAIVADVQAWVDNPTNNFGWILLSQNEGTPKTARRFGTRTSSSPVLEISYSAGVAPLLPVTLSGLQLVSNLFSFSFPTEPGRSYDVQARDALTNGTWTVLTNIPAGAQTNAVLTDSVTGLPQRFYRVETK
jgi:hypothetical protein